MINIFSGINPQYENTKLKKSVGSVEPMPVKYIYIFIKYQHDNIIIYFTL